MGITIESMVDGVDVDDEIEGVDVSVADGQ